MIIVDRFAGNNALYKGDRLQTLQRIPVGAKIKRAQAIISPVTETGEVGVSEDIISFAESNIGPNGETLTTVSQALNWAEVDFHRKVTLINVSAQDTNETSMQVDIGGGSFIEINENGAFRGPNDDAFTIDDGRTNMPGIELYKVKFTQVSSPVVTVESITVRNTASNVTLALGDGSSFLVQPGDLVESQTSIDFAQLLQASLSTVEQQNGFYLIPFILHTDTLSRLTLTLNIEVVSQQSALPESLTSIKLPYNYNAVSESSSNSLNVSIPAGSRLISKDSKAKIEGSFSNTKIVQGGVDQVLDSALQIEINSGLTQAQAFSINDQVTTPDIAVDSIDLLLTSVTTISRLQLDVRADLDGKPDAKSLLANAPELQIDIDTSPTPKWVNVSLSQPVKLKKIDANTQKPARYWLLVQSLDGEAQWSVADSSEDQMALLQQSTDGGLSWRENVVTDIAQQPYAEYRLRQNTDTFSIPVEVKVGTDEFAQRMKLTKFEPLGRIDFELDSEELTSTINTFLNDLEQEVCPQGEQLVNHEFELQLEMPTFTLVGWEQIGPGISPDANRLNGILIGSESDSSGISQTTTAVPRCDYELSTAVINYGESAIIQLIWKGEDCAPSNIDELILPATNETYFNTPQIYRLRVTAPEQVNQVEVRIIVPAPSGISLEYISLNATPQLVENFDLLETQSEQITNWTLTPADAVNQKLLTINIENEHRTIENIGNIIQPIIIAQSAPVQVNHFYNLEFIGTASLNNPAVTEVPEIQLIFLSEAGQPMVDVHKLSIAPESSDTHTLNGTVPESAVQAELRIVLPQGASLSLQSISLETKEPREVPIAFLSEAPGELTVTEFRVGFEDQAVPLPPLPESGFCAATPASQQPGDECEESSCSCFCPECGQTSELTQTSAVVLTDNRAATIGVCSDCGLPLISNRGLLSEATLSIPITKIDYNLLPELAATIALEEVPFIGNARAEVLITNGISRVSQLAAASPQYLVEILDVNEQLAEGFIANAKNLIVEDQLKALTTRVAVSNIIRPR